MSVSVYRGKFGAEQAERLLWRAGFGPRPGEAAALAAQGLIGATGSLVRPPKEKLTGPAPVDGDGQPIAPYDAWGHDGLWWLDRMVRSNRPLVERMTLLWHDWFATSNGEVGSQRLMLRQNRLFRRLALGSFRNLLLEVTRDPAMLIFLSGIENTKFAPNENYGRELMELFTLGAGRGYTERDVREQARALTGFRADYREPLGLVRFRFDRRLHDGGTKKILGKRGSFTWRDSCQLCLEHRNHPEFFITKLWSYFIPVAPPRATKAELERLYVARNYQVRPVLLAILRHPLLYEGPRMVKPPAVYLAGMLRALGKGIDRESWSWVSGLMGQQLFYPPNVAGWDDKRWLDTSTWRGRWIAVTQATERQRIETNAPYDTAEDPVAAVDKAIAFWGAPTISPQTRDALIAFSQRVANGATTKSKKRSYPILRQNALRTLVATCPDLQTC
ncbi:MAG: DUF1800 domain-containing protein [Solirubrobacterales bacterium]